MAQPQRADIPALVRRLHDGSEAEQADAAAALNQLYNSAGNDESKAAMAAAIAAAGAIPALLQLTGRPNEHPGATDAARLLPGLVRHSPARCEAIIAADGIEPLVRCLDSSSVADAQAAAATMLARIAAGQGAGDAGKAAVTASAAVPAAVRRLFSSDRGVVECSAGLLRNLTSIPEGRHAITVSGGIPQLLGLLRPPADPATAIHALSALANLARSGDAILLMSEAGAVPLVVELLAASNDAATVEAAGLGAHCMLLAGSEVLEAQFMEAGGLSAFVRCLQGQQFTSAARGHVAWCLGALAGTGAQPSQEIADAGGIGALVQALALPCGPETKSAVAFDLLGLLLNEQAAAVAAADPSDAVAAVLQWLPSHPRFANSPPWDAAITEALRRLAEARRGMPAAGAAAALAEASTAPAAGRSPARPPSVCAAPGCGATSSLKRCTGCHTALYCSKDCLRAHWKEHRPECKRLRAAAAAAAGEGPSSPGQA